jgi:hypothetical protein
MILACAGTGMVLLKEVRGRTGAYHQRVREKSAALLPLPDLRLEEAEPAPPAFAAIHPNLLVCKRARRSCPGEEATLLLAQSRRAEDLLGFSPPMYYVSRGWTERWRKPKDWEVGGTSIHGMEFCFRRRSSECRKEIVVQQFFLSPAGLTARDFSALKGRTSGLLARAYGAALFMVETNARWEACERDELLSLLITACAPVLGEITQGAFP